MKIALLEATFAISSVAIFAAIAGHNETCTAPTDDEFVELAIAETISSQSDRVVRYSTQGDGCELQLEVFRDRQSFLEANPSCCEVFTAQAIAEYIAPRQRRQANYSGSIRVQMAYQVIDNTDPDKFPHDTYDSIRVIHFDRCGQKINL